VPSAVGAVRSAHQTSDADVEVKRKYRTTAAADVLLCVLCAVCVRGGLQLQAPGRGGHQQQQVRKVQGAVELQLVLLVVDAPPRGSMGPLAVGRY
jgi:hypothetical protein